MQVNKKRMIFIAILAIVSIALSIVLSLAFGARQIPFNDVISSLFQDPNESLVTAIVHERIPRTIFALVAGACLGISGTVMQAATRNPIADSSVLGLNAGASLAVVIGIAFFGVASYFEYIVLALLGGTLTVSLVYFIAVQGGLTPLKLALSGVAITSVLMSLVSAIMLPRSDVIQVFRFWQVGSLSGATYEALTMMIPFILVGFMIVFFITSSLDVLSSGDEMALSLGVNVSSVRILAAIATVLLCGSTTAIGGPIPFVGLIVPHIVAPLAKSNFRLLMILSATFGSVLLTISDVLGRVIGQVGEVEVGIVTAFIGAPILIKVALSKKGDQYG